MGFVRGEPIRLAAVRSLNSATQIGRLSMGTKRKIWTTRSPSR